MTQKKREKKGKETELLHVNMTKEMKKKKQIRRVFPVAWSNQFWSADVLIIFTAHAFLCV